MYCFVILLLFNEMQMSVRRFSAIPHLRGRIPLGDFRTQQLLEALHRNIDTVTAAKCAQWYRLMQTYLPRCLNREVIEG